MDAHEKQRWNDGETGRCGHCFNQIDLQRCISILSVALFNSDWDSLDFNRMHFTRSKSFQQLEFVTLVIYLRIVMIESLLNQLNSVIKLI